MDREPQEDSNRVIESFWDGHCVEFKATCVLGFRARPQTCGLATPSIARYRRFFFEAILLFCLASKDKDFFWNDQPEPPGTKWERPRSGLSHSVPGGSGRSLKSAIFSKIDRGRAYSWSQRIAMASSRTPSTLRRPQISPTPNACK